MRNTISMVLGILLAACGGQAPPAEEPTSSSGPSAAEPSAPGEASSSAHMQHHFDDVAAARDAVVRGDLAAVRAPLDRIATASAPSDMPVDWAQWLEAMQGTARESAQAHTIDDAARSVAALGGACGDCHSATRGGPQVTEAAPPEAGEGLGNEMRRHAWGVEQLWLGLTAPSFQAWTRGAQAIRTDHGAAGANGDRAANAELDALHAAAARAEAAAQPGERVRVYGELLARCAACHSGTR